MKLRWPKWLVGSDDYTIELFLSKDGWRHRVTAVNGQTVLTSGESYSSRAKALQTAERLSASSGWPLVEAGLEGERPIP